MLLQRTLTCAPPVLPADQGLVELGEVEALFGGLRGDARSGDISRVEVERGRVRLGHQPCEKKGGHGGPTPPAGGQARYNQTSGYIRK